MTGNISTGKLFFKAVAEITNGNVKAEKRAKKVLLVI